MAEFKINDGILDEISNLKSAGNSLNGQYSPISPDDVRTLQAARILIAQHECIKKLVDLYKSLVLKEAQDLYDMVEEAKMMDTKIAGSTGGGFR